MKRDILLGIVAGFVALFVANRRIELPAGIYQAEIVAKKYREMEQSTKPAKVSAMETRQLLQKRIAVLEVEDARFDWLLGYLADVAGVKVTVEWSEVRQSAPPDQTVSVKLYDVSVMEALRETLAKVAPRKLGCRVTTGQVLISTVSRLDSEQVLRVYDVRDLLLLLHDQRRALQPRRGPPCPLPRENVSRPRGTSPNWLDFAVTEQDAVEYLVAFVESSIDVPSWRDNGGVSSICMISGKLIVTQSRENQDQVAIYLDWLREVMR